MGKGKTIFIWIVSILLALEFGFASSGKLMSQKEAVEGFHKVGYSDSFRLFIGAAEAAGAIGLLIPRLRFWAACGLSIIMIGAIATHIRTHDTLAHMSAAAISLVLLVLVAVMQGPRRRTAA